MRTFLRATMVCAQTGPHLLNTGVITILHCAHATQVTMLTGRSHDKQLDPDSVRSKRSDAAVIQFNRCGTEQRA